MSRFPSLVRPLLPVVAGTILLASACVPVPASRAPLVPPALSVRVEPSGVPGVLGTDSAELAFDLGSLRSVQAVPSWDTAVVTLSNSSGLLRQAITRTLGQSPASGTTSGGALSGSFTDLRPGAGYDLSVTLKSGGTTVATGATATPFTLSPGNNTVSVSVTPTVTNVTVTGSLRSATGGAAVSGASVTVLDGAGNTVATATSGANGAFSVTVPPNVSYIVTVSASGYLPNTYYDVLPTPGMTLALLTMDEVSTSAVAGKVAGKIIDAVTGNGINGATINLRPGTNHTSGPVTTALTTGSGGTINAQATNTAAGPYTAEVLAAGYATASFNLNVQASTNAFNEALVPYVTDGRFRAVVSWAATPQDLDFHVYGPAAGGPFHVYWSRLSAAYAPDQAVSLDRDDTDGYGPETITLPPTLTNSYHFYVGDYTNHVNANSTAMSASGARFKLYQGSTLKANLSIPLNSPGVVWDVGSVTGSTWTPVNAVQQAITGFQFD